MATIPLFMPFSLPEKVPQVLIKKGIAMCFKQSFPAEKEKSDLIKIKSDFVSVVQKRTAIKSTH